MADSVEKKVLKPKKGIKDFIDSLVIAFVIAMIIRTFFISAYRIPTGSMLDTLQIGDHLIASKLSYYIGKPQFGDVAIFEYPMQPSLDYVKRVIGTPGDEIEIINKVVYRNGVKLDEPYVITTNRKDYIADNIGKFTVPEGMYFMMGDNRDHSYDSRFWGFVPLKAFKGKAFFIYWSKEPGRFSFDAYRFNRMLKIIH